MRFPERMKPTPRSKSERARTDTSAGSADPELETPRPPGAKAADLVPDAADCALAAGFALIRFKLNSAWLVAIGAVVGLAKVILR